MSQVHKLIELLNKQDPIAVPVPTSSSSSTTTTTSNPQYLPSSQITSTSLIHNMLLYVNTELTIQETEKAVKLWRQDGAASSSSSNISTGNKPLQLLSRVGKFLEGIFKHKAPVARIVAKDIIGKGSRYLFDEVIR